MLKNFFIWFLFIPVFCLGQEQTAEYNLTIPDFIPFNTSFEISLITSNISNDPDILTLAIDPSERIKISVIQLNTDSLSMRIPILRENFRGNTYKFDLNLRELNIHSGEFFNLIIQLKPEGILSGSINIDGIFYKDGEEVGYLHEGRVPIHEEINFYKPNKAAGKCLEINDRDYLNIKNINSNSEKLLAEFWFKTASGDIDFLNITGLGGDHIFSCGLNSSQVLEVNSRNPVVESFPIFLSKGTWNHFAMFFSIPDQEAKIYCNDVPVAVYRLNLRSLNELSFNFSSHTESPYYIDLFRFIAVRGDLNIRFRDRNYLSYLTEGSVLLTQIEFDDPAEFRNASEYVEFLSPELVRSDAPIFPRAPELNVQILSHAFMLEWSGGDFKHAEEYVIEKSTGNAFRVIGSVSADNAVEKSYSYIDERDAGNDILYYRIKQINKDGSEVYSTEVKIGHGSIEPFTIAQNYPNPFNPTTAIEIELLIDSEVEIVVYNLEGSEVGNVYKGVLSKGIHKFEFDGEGLPSGIYLYKVSTPEFSQTRKMILAK